MPRLLPPLRPMIKSKFGLPALGLVMTAALIGRPVAFSAPTPTVEARRIALAAFRTPTVPFQAKLMLTQWRNGESRAEEARLYFSPPNSYRIEFLDFDGAVKKVVLTDEKNARVSVPSLGASPLESEVAQVPNLLGREQIEELLISNYDFELKGAESFIGRQVWVVNMIPRTTGKPFNELRVDQQTMVVLEQRRYVAQDEIGSLTRFSSFEPNKTASADLFSFGTSVGLIETNKDVQSRRRSEMPLGARRQLPAGFSLNGFRTFEVQGTLANHFTYTDGALPLSVFETKLPVHFPSKPSMSEKTDAIVPSNGFSSTDQVLYAKKGKNYFTIIGEASPALLQTISNTFE